jgi:lipopolysaccharide transport system ATP-binding protein
MKPIVEVKGLWKEYQRGAQKEKYLSLRDNLFKSFKPSAKKESFWALQDINFEVYPGDSLAIIGKNGAGKSTLLKILSKITPPTKGEITLRGRLASLLEVGTGFHPELTGRENIYLNGSILGLGRSEINRQFDAIVDFSGVEAFLDTPLKHYSSGMQLRLAFAVAAHLEPEVLVIDEVLAVGDSVFQQKCIAKMTEVSASGRTILFVSHNFQAVKNLCTSGILLENGRLAKTGDIDKVLMAYNDKSKKFPSEFRLNEVKPRRGANDLIFDSLSSNLPSLQWGETFHFSVKLKSKKQQPFLNLEFGIALQDVYNQNVIHISNKYISANFDRHENDRIKYNFEIENNLKQGKYNLVLFLRANDIIQDWISDFAFFEVPEGNRYGYHKSSEIQGIIQPVFTVKTEVEDN